MLKHIVMYHLKDFAEGKSKQENALLLKSVLEGLNGTIKELGYAEVGINVNPTDEAYDAVLYSEFDSEEDFNAYVAHPEHVKAGQIIGKIRNDRAVADYIV